MSRTILAVAVVLLLALSGHAKPVTPERAAVIAKAFLDSQAGHPRKAKHYVVGSSHSLQPYYVFNAADGQGFVIVSGDDQAVPILAYSDQGHIDSADMPEACQWWLDFYASQIASLQEDGFGGYTTEWPADSIQPLLETRWGQGAPFNLLCPIDEKEGLSQRSSAGCVATAMSQIMYYHRWPRRGKGLISYSDTRQDNAERQLYLDTIPDFDWEHMLLSYADAAGSEQEQMAVARLVRSAGYAARTNYSHGNSTTYERLGAAAFFDYFGYDPNVHHYVRTYVSDRQWTELLLTELRAGRPVLYTGFNAHGGHTFVCDGYDGHGLFHFNWGWNGSSDGYFSLSALTPSKQQQGGSDGSTYTFGQCIATNIQPPSDSSLPQTDHLAVTSLYIVDGNNQQYPDWMFAYGFETVSLGCRLLNTGVTDLNAEVCIGEQTEDGLTELNDPVALMLRSNYGRNYLFPLKKELLTDGDHVLQLFFRPADTLNWQPVPTPMDGVKAVSISSQNGGHRLATVTSDFHLRLSDSFIPGAFYTNRTRPLRLPIVNDGKMTLSRKVGCRLTGETVDRLIAVSTFCPVGDSAVVVLPIDMTGLPVGHYTLMPFYCNSTSYDAEVTTSNITAIAEPMDVTVGEVPRITIEMQGEPYLLDLSTGTIDFMLFQSSALIPWSGRIMGRVQRVVDPWSGAAEDTGVVLYSDYMTLERPAIVNAQLYADHVGLPVGDDYRIVFYIDDQNDYPLYSASLSVVDAMSGIDPARLGPEATKAYDLKGLPLSGNRKGIRITTDHQPRKTIIR
ncbi:MAG: C10 family peptidase [Prevotella sp.]|nr:C10 family peptidase [Prevotella sp.]